MIGDRSISEKENSSGFSIVLEPTGTILYASKGLGRIIGEKPVSLTGRQLQDLGEGQFLRELHSLYESVLIGGDSQEQRKIADLRDGTGGKQQWLLVGRFHRIDQGRLWIILRGRHAGEFSHSREREEVPFLTAECIIDAGTGKILEAKGALEELTGRPKQALIGTPHKNLYPSVEHADYEALVFRLAHVGEMLFHGIRLRHPDGHTIPAEFSAKNVEWSGKQAAQVTFRTLNNSASEHEIRFFQNALESLLEGICLTDLDNRLLFVNTEFQTIFGYESEEVLGKPMDFILSAQDQLDIKQDPRFTFLEEDIWTGEITARRKDGTSFPANLSKSTIQNNSEIPLGSIYIVKNISEKKRLEEEMVRTEKLRGLSTLAGGIAHDFNNILTAVLGNLSLARLYEDDPEKMQTILERTEQAARRATGLTTQLLTFSKGGQPIQKQVKVRNLLRGVLDFTLSGSNVNYRLQLSKNLYPVSIDMDQMNQALHNIILNAVQAMPKGGTITVTAENKIIDKSNRLPGLEGRYYVQIRFTDQGPGISESDLPKVFDPFFTTKTTGSGLGLATTYSIVRRHKGTVSIESFNDRGTTVVLYLPAVITAEEETMVSEERRIPRSKGRVLVMDDEKGIREVCTEFLKYMGFEAVEAADGESAFQIYKEAYQGGKPFDAVIMDLTVPGGMGGQETIRRLREFDDKVRAIVSSGYSTSPVMANYQEYGFQGVVSKPYQLEDLKQVLEQVLS